MRERRKRRVVTARDERGRRHTVPEKRPEPPMPCEECGVENRVDYEGSYVGEDDEIRESYSGFYCGACGAENVWPNPIRGDIQIPMYTRRLASLRTLVARTTKAADARFKCRVP
jgi:hypothetical protein